MKILFAHQNFPGQYLHLAPYFARAGHEVVAISSRNGVAIPGIRVLAYKVPPQRASGTHRFLVKTEEHVLRGEQVAALALKLASSGFRPDVICAHPGWGEALYFDDIWKGVPQLHYCEFFFAPFCGPSQFRSRDPVPLDSIFDARTRNAMSLISLHACTAGVTPTLWQWQQFPSAFQSRISVVHEGVNVSIARPATDAAFLLPNGRRFTRADRVVTYVSRNLEPTRGFPEFMRAAALLLQRQADTEILIVGGDEVSYGPLLPKGETWRERMLREVDIDRKRVHFLGKIPYLDYIRLLQVSNAHVYLTVPFVLSWSLLEAMAAGCTVIGSDTAPVREVIEDGRNGLLVDYFDPHALAMRIEEALRGGRAFESIREEARRTVSQRYSLAQCLPQQVALVERTANMR